MKIEKGVTEDFLLLQFLKNQFKPTCFSLLFVRNIFAVAEVKTIRQSLLPSIFSILNAIRLLGFHFSSLSLAAAEGAQLLD